MTEERVLGLREVIKEVDKAVDRLGPEAKPLLEAMCDFAESCTSLVAGCSDQPTNAWHNTDAGSLATVVSCNIDVLRNVLEPLRSPAHNGPEAILGVARQIDPQQGVELLRTLFSPKLFTTKSLKEFAKKHGVDQDVLRLVAVELLRIRFRSHRTREGCGTDAKAWSILAKELWKDRNTFERNVEHLDTTRAEIEASSLESADSKPQWATSRDMDAYGRFASLELGIGKHNMRWIPPGTFWMGSPEDEVGRDADELRHEVKLTKGFWLAETACTQELWEAVMGQERAASRRRGEQCPITGVSWDMCCIFFEKVRERHKTLKLRLPTEAEWEYACRAGSEDPYSFGRDVDGAQARFASDSAADFSSFQPNAWGLKGMHGNVSEWCSDWYGMDYLVGIDDPKGPTSGTFRVLRGGWWSSPKSKVRSARRDRAKPQFCLPGVGFRFAIDE